MGKVHLGARTRITVGREATYGYPWTVPAAGWKEFPETPGETLKDNISSFTQNTLFADRMVRGISTGQHSPGGSLPFELMSRGQLTLFQYALGGATDIYEYGDNTVKYRVFYGSQDEASFPSSIEGGDPETGVNVGGLTIRKWFLVENPSSDEDLSPDSFMLEYSGSKVNGFSLSVPTDGFVTGNFDIMSLKESQHDYYPGASAGWTAGYWIVDPSAPPAEGLLEINDPAGEYISNYASPSADRALTSVRLANDASFSGYVKLGLQGSSPAIATVQAIDFNVTNNAERVQVVGNTQAYSIEFGRRQITGNLTVVLSDLTYYNYFKNETDLELYLKFDASYPDAENEYLIFAFPRIRIGGEGSEAPTPSVTGPGPLSLTLPFQALRCASAINLGEFTLPEYTDIYMIAQLDGAGSEVSASQFYL